MVVEFMDSGFRHILDAISDGVYVTTDEREIVFWSEGAERITGYQAMDVVGKHCFDDILVHTDSKGHQLCFSGCPLQDCIEHGIDRAVNEVFLKRSDGERLPVYVKTAVFKENGRTFGVEIFGELESVAGHDLAAQVQELSDSSVEDPLTGLFNRRYVDASLQQYFALFQRMGRHYGVLYFDIDDFKSVNDGFGHDVGDEALKFISAIVGRSARQMDIAARYGGDEFVVVCAVATPAELEACGRRLLELVRGSSFGPLEGSEKRMTISIGGTLVSAADTNERDALTRADRAMYRAKESGRDGLVLDTAN